MANIPDTAYITVNKDGIFVGGKPATTYRGEDICGMQSVKNMFAGIQEQNPNITELHVLSSKTSGGYATVGNPSPEHGRYAWCRVKNNDGKLGGWGFCSTYTSATDCANDCAFNCARNVRADAAFRRAVFGLIDKQNSRQKQNALTNALKDTDLSELIGTHTIGSYEIVVRKSGQNTRG